MIFFPIFSDFFLQKFLRVFLINRRTALGARDAYASKKGEKGIGVLAKYILSCKCETITSPPSPATDALDHEALSRSHHKMKHIQNRKVYFTNIFSSKRVFSHFFCQVLLIKQEGKSTKKKVFNSKILHITFGLFFSCNITPICFL